MHTVRCSSFFLGGGLSSLPVGRQVLADPFPRRQTPLSLCRQTPCRQPPNLVNRQTCVRTLPCPKLRLQAVTGNAGSRIFVSIIPLLSHYSVVNGRGTTVCEEYENVYTAWVTLFTVDASHAGETGETDRSQTVGTVITGWMPNVLLLMTLKKWLLIVLHADGEGVQNALWALGSKTSHIHPVCVVNEHWEVRHHTSTQWMRPGK